MKIPGPDHPITVSPNPKRVVVRFGEKTVADTMCALSLKEASYPTIFYIPREDAKMSLFKRSEHITVCPYKGDASHYSLVVDGKRAANVVWTYETPHAAVAAIKDHLAFYPDRVDAIEESAA